MGSQGVLSSGSGSTKFYEIPRGVGGALFGVGVNGFPGKLGVLSSGLGLTIFYLWVPSTIGDALFGVGVN